MEDEIIKNSGQIFRKLKENDGIFGKIKSILGEVLVIGFAVSFSIWINQWAEHRKEQQDVQDFLQTLKDELESDWQDLDRCRHEVESADQTNAFLLSLDENSLDSIKRNNISIGFNSKPIIRRSHSAGYEGFKTSGQLVHIEDAALRSQIMDYYEVLMPSLQHGEELYSTRCLHSLDLIFNRVSEKGKDALLEKRIKMDLGLSLQFGKGLPASYQRIQRQIKNIQLAIRNDSAERAGFLN